MITNCPVCGKAFDVLWPHLWRFRRGGHYLCSYGCLRQSDKGEFDMDKFTKEQKAEAVRIALEGGDPKAYLKSIGSARPDRLWYYMKTQLLKKDPETYEKLAGSRKRAPAGKAKSEFVPVKKAGQIETPEGELARPGIGGLRPPPDEAEVPEKKYVTFVDGGLFPKISAIPYKVTGVSTSAGDFQYFKKSGYIDWTALDGGTVSMNLEEWKEFMTVFPEVLRLLGVEL